MTKTKTEDIRPGDMICIEMIVDSVTLRADGTVELRTEDGQIINRVQGLEFECTRSKDRKIPPPIPPVAPPGAPAISSPALNAPANGSPTSEAPANG